MRRNPASNRKEEPFLALSLMTLCRKLQKPLISESRWINYAATNPVRQGQIIEQARQSLECPDSDWKPPRAKALRTIRALWGETL